MFLYKSITLPARGNHKNNFMVADWYCFRYKTQSIVKKRQGGTQTLYNILELIEARSGENESSIICSHKHSSCLKVDLEDITTSKEYVTRWLPHQIKEDGAIKATLKAEVKLEDTLPFEFKANQKKIIRLEVSRYLLDSSIEKIDNQILYCIQTQLYFKKTQILHNESRLWFNYESWSQ